MTGKLQLIATPIGNLGDLSARAIDTLNSADQIACEDTRHSGRLLQHYQISRPLLSLNEHNEGRRIPELLQKLQEGRNIALISDAGNPTLSDPGQRLVHAAIHNDIAIEVIPGASAVLTALIGSGLPTVPFYFGGFLPHKKGQREKEIIAAMDRDCTSLYFESPYRLVDTLEMAARYRPEHRVVVARELTKMFEEFHRGSAQSVLEHFKSVTPKGEITLVIAPRELPNWMLRAEG